MSIINIIDQSYICIISYNTIQIENEQSIISCIKIEKIEGKKAVLKEYVYVITFILMSKTWNSMLVGAYMYIGKSIAKTESSSLHADREEVDTIRQEHTSDFQGSI